MTDVLIRDVPDDVIVALDPQAGRLGLSRERGPVAGALDRQEFGAGGADEGRAGSTQATVLHLRPADDTRRLGTIARSP